MKSQHLRSEKNCLNCNTEVPERYCPHCGQENTVQHESFGHLVGHVVADIAHYDSKLLATLKYLTVRPGLLTKEYWAGRRMRYVNPIKLYVFISAVFFFFFLALANSHREHNAKPGIETELADVEMGDIGSDYKSVAEYDAAQAAKPASQRNTGLEDRIERRLAKMRENKQSGKEVIKEMFTHNLPKMMFVLMPLFALMVKWTHRKRNLLFTDHAIFTIHLHSFLFIILFVGLVLRYFIHDGLPLELAYWGAFLYFVLALKDTYQQSFWKSLVKATLLCCGYFSIVVILFVFAIFGVLAAY
ncbi:DUF3667 domain-containing protein [Chitinophaga sp. G-6-1-13]|uniref:DUF3667 domain-containing protein n=1 Tax=Chitinophaga fulva TaxID=2728842 RepID=A0A848GUZ4_9BACT|nr:DUF3667 domain-containing protein [Chitinophaga fulva]NML41002.1 DUF3667 domain-containing protein [Chitinophaga fulva]